MRSFRTSDQLRTYRQLATAWASCTHFGTISSGVDRINDVPSHLVKLGVTDLIPYLLINENLKGFVYKADLDRKNLIHIVEIYHDMRPHGTEWRERNAQFALWLDRDLVDGLDDDVAVTNFVIPFAKTALEEVMLNY